MLLDGLGPWIAGRLHQAGAFADADRLPGAGREVLAELDRVLQALAGAAAAIVVAEQAGEGVLPADAASCAWVDLMGEAAQRFAGQAERVELVVAGRSIPLGRALPTPPADPSLRRHGDRDVRPGDADHAVNVVAGGPPPWLRAALADALETDAGRYPREDEAIAAHRGASRPPGARDRPDQRRRRGALAPAGRRCGPAWPPCVHPGFTEAEAALHAHGSRRCASPATATATSRIDPALVPEAADLVVVGNPASPSGTLGGSDCDPRTPAPRPDRRRRRGVHEPGPG